MKENNDSEDSFEETVEDIDPENARDFNTKSVKHAEKVWTNLFDKYLLLYADNPTLPDKANFYSEIDKRPYCTYFKDNCEILMTPLTLTEVQSIMNKQRTSEYYVQKQVQDYEFSHDNNKSDFAVIQYLYTFRLKMAKKMVPLYQKVYQREFKKKEHDFYSKLYSHLKNIFEEFEAKVDYGSSKDIRQESYPAKFYTMVIEYFKHLNEIDEPTAQVIK